jgi:calcineurin-like phosphoesterase family protein
MRGASIAASVTALVALLSACSDGGSDKSVAAGSFPASDSKREVVVWAVGDGDAGSAGKKVAQLIARDRPDRMLYLGDVYDDGTRQEFAKNYAPSFGRLAKITAPTPGNHDWPNHSEGYRPYWRKATGKRIPGYYSFSTGGWQLLSLNSEAPHGAGSAQVKWLRSKLRGRGDCRVAFWHRPRYSAGTEHGDQGDMQPFWDALRGHAALVLNGHEHDMQRFQPRDGITELVSGAGGHSHYGLKKGYPGLAFGDGSSWGALRVSLSRGSARYRFVSTEGRTLDQSTTRCKPR